MASDIRTEGPAALDSQSGNGVEDKVEPGAAPGKNQTVADIFKRLNDHTYFERGAQKVEKRCIRCRVYSASQRVKSAVAANRY